MSIRVNINAHELCDRKGILSCPEVLRFFRGTIPNFTRMSKNASVIYMCKLKQDSEVESIVIFMFDSFSSDAGKLIPLSGRCYIFNPDDTYEERYWDRKDNSDYHIVGY